MGKDLQGLPKALIRVGDKAIIWHIMKYYSHFGFNDFVLCMGYKGIEIERYFKKCKEFKIQFADTGIETNTGGRIRRIEKFIDSDNFFVTYGDGLSNINLKRLLNFHKAHKKMATLTAVRPRSMFGIVGVDSHSNLITHFQEKPLLDHWINGGFFVFDRGIFRYLKQNDVLEEGCFERLLKFKGLIAYKHRGFWECMDTYKDNLRLNQLWKNNFAPWAIWKGRRHG